MGSCRGERSATVLKASRSSFAKTERVENLRHIVIRALLRLVCDTAALGRRAWVKFCGAVPQSSPALWVNPGLSDGIPLGFSAENLPSLVIKPFVRNLWRHEAKNNSVSLKCNWLHWVCCFRWPWKTVPTPFIHHFLLALQERLNQFLNRFVRGRLGIDFEIDHRIKSVGQQPNAQTYNTVNVGRLLNAPFSLFFKHGRHQ
mgnify:CR=1 FL=1